MIQRLWPSVFAFLSLACASAPAPKPAVHPASNATAQTTEAKLSEKVRALSTISAPNEHVWAETVELLADALNEDAATRESASAELRRIARRLRGADSRSPRSAAVFKEALQLAYRSLMRLPIMASRIVAYESLGSEVGRLLDALNPDVSLVAQREKAARALRGETSLLFFSRGLAAAFEDIPFELPQPREANTVDAISAARAAVRRVAQAPRGAAHKEIAEAIEAIARTVELAGAPSMELRTTLRDAADQFRQATFLTFGQTVWVKDALAAALDALTQVDEVKRVGLDLWVQEARIAVRALDANASLLWQRSAVQDAMRATVDAYAAFALGRRTTSSGGDRSPRSGEDRRCVEAQDRNGV